MLVASVMVWQGLGMRLAKVLPYVTPFTIVVAFVMTICTDVHRRFGWHG
jgi:hypothetical protein